MATRISIGSGTLIPTPVLPWAISGTVNVGDVVYQVSGADRTVARASASDSSKRPPIGVVIGKSNSTVDVAVHGEKIAGLSGLVAGTTYWLGADGALVDTRPASNAYVVGLALSSSELLVDVTSAEINASGGGGGGVTSAGIGSADASFATSGGPVTGSGSIDVTLNTVAVADGGTGLTSAAEAGAMLVASGSGAYVSQNVSPFQRNRLINGAHMVSQRNADTPVQPNQNVYTTDRWVGGSNMLNSVYFDGSGDYLGVADNIAFDLAAQNFTIEAWFNIAALPSSGAGYGLVAQWKGGASLSLGWLCSLYNNAGTYQLFFAYSTTGTNTVSLPVNMSSAPVVGTWYHVAFVRSGNNFLVFLNGTQVGVTQTLNATVFNAVTELWIGAQNNDGAGTPANVMNGYISNLRIVKGTAVYTSNFTPSQIPLTAIANTSLLTCAASTMSDLSANNFTVTPAGNAAVNALNPFRNFLAGRMQGWSNYFDGSGDYLSVPRVLDTSGDVTIECWVYLSANPTATAAWIINQYLAADAGRMTLYITSSRTVGMQFGATAVTGTTAIALNTWNHLAWVRSGSAANNFKLYINGVFDAQNTYTGSFTNTPMTIGGEPTVANSWLNGYISNVRVLEGTALYTSNFTPLTTPLVPVANTSLLTCGSEIFQDKSQNNFTITPVGNAAVSSLNPFTAQAPTGSVASLRWSVTSAASALATQYAQVQQRIEGTSVYDFAWGSASAKAVTLSFWVRSPVTGTYCASIQNAAQNRSYVAEYTVSAANTWEKKVISIAGDTSGTWPTTTSESMRVAFDVGSGANFNTTAGAWQAGNYSRTTNQTNFIGTALSAGVQSNDFAISNVQLELGSVATPFEFRPMQAEVALCQRYYARLRSLSGNYVAFGAGHAQSANGTTLYMSFPQVMRSAPVISQSETCVYDTAPRQTTGFNGYYSSTSSAVVYTAHSAGGLTLARAVVWCGNNNPNAYVELNAEL